MSLMRILSVSLVREILIIRWKGGNVYHVTPIAPNAPAPMLAPLV